MHHHLSRQETMQRGREVHGCLHSIPPRSEDRTMPRKTTSIRNQGLPRERTQTTSDPHDVRLHEKSGRSLRRRPLSAARRRMTSRVEKRRAGNRIAMSGKTGNENMQLQQSMRCRTAILTLTSDTTGRCGRKTRREEQRQCMKTSSRSNGNRQAKATSETQGLKSFSPKPAKRGNTSDAQHALHAQKSQKHALRPCACLPREIRLNTSVPLPGV